MAPVLDPFSAEHSMVSHIQLLFTDKSRGVGLLCDIPDPHTGRRKFKYMTAECNEKALLDSLSLSCLPPLPLSGTFICLLP